MKLLIGDMEFRLRKLESGGTTKASTRRRRSGTKQTQEENYLLL